MTFHPATTSHTRGVTARIVPAAMILLLMGAAWLPFLDNLARDHIDAGMTRSLASFATARALNAVISVAQGTETAFQPAGVGVVLTPGQALDPINDLVERFADLMLLATIAFGAERILVDIGAMLAIPLLVTVTGLATVTLHLLGRPVPGLLARALVLLLVVRFAVPVMTAGSHWLFEQFMEARYEASQQFLATSSEQLPTPAGADTPPAGEQPGWYENLLGRGFGLPDIKIPESPVASLKQKLTASISHIIDLMVIFVLQVLVLPLLILWVIAALAKRLVER